MVAKRILLGLFALALGLVFADGASAQRLCSKTNAKGKTKYAVRQICKTSEVDEGQVALTSDIPAPAVAASVSATTNGNNQFGTLVTLLDLDGAGTQVFSFTTTAASSDVVVTFSAECSVRSVTTQAWMDLDVIVDGTVVPPTNSGSDAFCTEGEGNNVDEWTRASATVLVPNLPAGSHNIEIRVQSGFGVQTWWIGDLSLVVQAFPD